VLVDLNESIEINIDTILSKSKNSPFLGCKLQGRVDMTFCEGKITWDSRRPLED